MTSKINELVEKIYTEAVEKAEEKAKIILSEAEEKAARLLNDSKLEAERIIQEASTQSKKIYQSIYDELHLISNQVLAVTKQKITDCILTETSKKLADELLNDTEFVKSFFIELVKKWDMENSSVEDLTVLMSEEQLKSLQESFNSGVFKTLKNQPKIDIIPESGKGFKIISTSNGFKISFNEDDFENFFKSFMKPKTKKYLFEKQENV
ncbi:MAG: hypothetical protein GXO81_11610 [Chlorobi bacterium]|nr:hypothetical protein [Chlorobiota bacterium]